MPPKPAKRQKTLAESLSTGRKPLTSDYFSRANGASPAKASAKNFTAADGSPATKRKLATNGGANKSVQTNNNNTPSLFDYYPNLRKDAPLFRADVAQTTRQSPTATGKDAVGVHPGEVVREGAQEATAHMTFEDDERPTRSEVCIDQMTDGQVLFEDDDDEEEHPAETSEKDVDQDAGDGDNDYGGEEASMREERDDFEMPREDSVMPGREDDESWTWQEYNAETFGNSQTDPADGQDAAGDMACPICGAQLKDMAETARSTHVNACLDVPEPATKPEPVVKVEPTARWSTAEPKEQLIKLKAETSIVKAEPIEPQHEFGLKRDCSPPVGLIEDPIKDEFDAALPELKHEASSFNDGPADVKFEMLQEDEEDGDADAVAGTAKSAFSKIMVSHAEEKKWASAAKTELAQRGTRYRDRKCPFYKIMTPLPIAVDAFKYGKVPGIQCYILTHFHSDHYGGLSGTWNAGPIYCSSITGNLCIQQLKVKPEYIVKLPMDTPCDVHGVTVTLIDANHCPGSAIFVLEAPFKGRQLRYLHCGDYRATPEQLLHPALRGRPVDCLYLDTTYLSPKYSFPTQTEVIDACAYVCKDLAGLAAAGDNPVAEARDKAGVEKFFRRQDSSIKGEDDGDVKPDMTAVRPTKSAGRLLVVVGTYSIGKERIVLGIARALDSRIYCGGRKREIMRCLEDPELELRLTDDPLAAQVHMTYLQEIRAETLQDYLVQFHPHFGRIVGFRGTGWTYSPPKDRFLDNPSVEMILSWRPKYDFRKMQPGRGSTARAACYGVPYSEHSSFRELMCFVLACDIGRVIPTVNVGSAKSRERMKAWITKWEIERRKSGLLALRDGQVDWD